MLVESEHLGIEALLQLPYRDLGANSRACAVQLTIAVVSLHVPGNFLRKRIPLVRRSDAIG